jgi:hypothetical protein
VRGSRYNLQCSLRPLEDARLRSWGAMRRGVRGEPRRFELGLGNRATYNPPVAGQLETSRCAEWDGTGEACAAVEDHGRLGWLSLPCDPRQPAGPGDVEPGAGLLVAELRLRGAVSRGLPR